MRRAVLAGAALTAVVSAPALGHVVLTRAEVPAEVEVELAMRAPIEREGTTNREIYALVPGPFVVTGCKIPSVAWQCTLDTSARPGSTFITWETPVAGSPQDLRFEFTVRTPASKDAGDYKFPVVQTYSDGHVARWIQDSEPSPAPRLRVVPKGQPVSTAEPTPPPDASAPAVAPAPSRTAPSRSAAATPTRSTTAAAAAVAATGVATASSAGISAEPTSAPDLGPTTELGGRSSSSGGVGLAWSAVAIGLLTAAAAGVVVVVRRRSGPAPR